MKYGNMTLGQVEAIINKIGGETGVKNLLADKLSVDAIQSKNLDFIGSIGEYPAIMNTGGFNPRMYFESRSELNIWRSFLDEILIEAKPTKAGKGFQKGTFVTIKMSSLTGNIVKEAFPDSVWSATAFCSWLSSVLTLQSQGKIGILQREVFPNYFLVEGIAQLVFTVKLSWGDTRLEKWRISTSNLDYKWLQWSRFFLKPIDVEFII